MTLFADLPDASRLAYERIASHRYQQRNHKRLTIGVTGMEAAVEDVKQDVR
jgi:hypothetical protein